MIEQFEHLLKGLIGLDAESVGRSVIERALRQRMQASACADAASYWALLNQSGAERQALVEAVVVPETWFFRYPESFALLLDLARQRQAALAASRPLRLLSLPCSSGEEPYSMAMALLDGGFSAEAFRIEALDVSQQVLRRAAEGRFGRNSFRSRSLAFRDRHFLADGDAYRLQEAVRRSVSFRPGNLLDPELFAGEPAFDFIFCRNLLIYFDRPTQNRALQALQRLLAADGTLFVGPAEAGLTSQHAMQALGVAATFAFRRARAAERPQPPAPPLARAASSPVAPLTRPPRTPPATLAPFPATPLARSLVRGSEAADAALAQLVALANAGRHAEARLACEKYLYERGPHAEVFYWLGLLHDAGGDSDAARDYYRKALYLEPGHAESLAHLAALLAARGDREGARRLQQRAERAGQAGVMRDGR